MVEWNTTVNGLRFFALRRFYVCLGGVGTPRTCPETLYFNPLTNQCDHPQNTDCPKVRALTQH